MAFRVSKESPSSYVKEEGTTNMIRSIIMITITVLCFTANTLADEPGTEFTGFVAESPASAGGSEKPTKVQVTGIYLRGYPIDAPGQNNECSSNSDCVSGQKCCSLGEQSWCWSESKNCCEAYGGC